MATPALRSFSLATARGTIRSAGGVRPTVVTCGVDAETGERLARAGFAVVTLEPPSALHEVLRALDEGALGPAPRKVAVLVSGEGCAAMGDVAGAAGMTVVTLDDGLDQAIRRLAEALT